MTDAVIVAIIAALPPTLVALATLRASRKTVENTQKIHLEINSRMSQLLSLTKQSSMAEGAELERVRNLREEC